ncbi:hypothetical protein X739_32925 [Mesorhizobium sp. LNHC220B00]|nr:hypothetical protein [Mesorhizobium sp. LNHC220B00]ESY77445.1 hypothetical protein X739_32925 [Mesorhizobium sp. LNHC220B00]
MKNYVLFHMWEPSRQSLIKRHEFYVEQARKRVLSQFSSIEAEAETASHEWLDEMSTRFDLEAHEPGDFYEAAHEAGIEFYQLLSDMHDQTRLSVVAGMFHEWDKQLRDWLVAELRHWHQGENATSKVWAADFSRIADLLESFGWKVRETAYFKLLDACRLVVNVYKHGSGRSLEDLKNVYPEYLHDALKAEGLPGSPDLLDYTNLKVSDDQFQAFSDAIVAFWRDVPGKVTAEQMGKVPGWFRRAILSGG